MSKTDAVDAHMAIHVISDVLHDASIEKGEMAKKASDYYFAEFAGKRDKIEFCIFIGMLIGILCENLQTAMGETPSGPAN